MKHKGFFGNSEAGAVAMITVMFVIAVFTVMVLGFVRVMLSEQRQSTDDDVSNRAFYAAESGVEDAKGALADYLETGNSSTFDECNTYGEPFLIDQSELSTQIVCQTIDTELPDVSIDARAWRSYLVPLESNESFDSFTLDWHRPAFDFGTTLKGDRTLHTTANWSAAEFPAAMKMTLVPAASSGSGDSIDNLGSKVRVMYLLPGTGIPTSFDVSDPDFARTGNGPEYASCNLSGSEYACSVNFTISAVNNYRIVLTPLYRSTSMRVSLRNASGDPVDIVDVQAEVDVTARAGDIFRRVQARLSLVDEMILPDTAVAGNEICKDYSYSSGASDFTSINSGIGSDYCIYSP